MLIQAVCPTNATLVWGVHLVFATLIQLVFLESVFCVCSRKFIFSRERLFENCQLVFPSINFIESKFHHIFFLNKLNRYFLWIHLGSWFSFLTWLDQFILLNAHVNIYLLNKYFLVVEASLLLWKWCFLNEIFTFVPKLFLKSSHSHFFLSRIWTITCYEIIFVG